MTGISPTSPARHQSSCGEPQRSGSSSGHAADPFLAMLPSISASTRANCNSSPATTSRSGCTSLEYVQAVTAALRNLGADISTARQFTDYEAGCDALRDWALDEVTWQHITASLPPIPGPNQPVTADRKRQDASVYIWTALSGSGQNLFAPRPIQAQQPAHIQKYWATRHNTTWFQISLPDPLRHYADLRFRPRPVFEYMARRIDGGTPAPVAEREARQLKR